MVNVKNEVIKQLLKLLKEVDEKAKSPHQKTQLLREIAEINSILNK